MLSSSRAGLATIPYLNATVCAPTAQPRPGTYALLLSSATDQLIRIGRLGDLRLQPGYYVYVGSALGPGGVRGRLAHHMRLVKRPYWHIDYLRRHTTLEAVWFCYHRKSLEHSWAKRFAAMPGASVPMAGFGSSDCGCESHLFFISGHSGADRWSGGVSSLCESIRLADVCWVALLHE
jgi:Uri superfamily endonuclease